LATPHSGKNKAELLPNEWYMSDEENTLELIIKLNAKIAKASQII
jgi:hypothetical protein